MNYTFRMHDPRVGRFFTTDPLESKYAWNSPYAFSANRVMDRNELEGLETGPTFTEVISLSKNSKLSLNKASEILYGSQTKPMPGCKGVVRGLKNLISLNWWKQQAVGLVESYANSNGFNGIEGGMIEGKKAMIASDKFKKVIKNKDVEAVTQFVVETVGTTIILDQLFKTSNLFNGEANIKPMIFSENFSIGVKTLAIVEKHLSQFGFKAENAVMLERMKSIASKTIEATEIDINFAKHELQEKRFMDAGMSYEEAHIKTLKEQNMYHKNYQEKLYTKEAIEAGDKQLMNEASDK